MRKEMSLWLHSSAWKLSCYSYKKGAPSIPRKSRIFNEFIKFEYYSK
jgi:hypothetical protein